MSSRPRTLLVVALWAATIVGWFAYQRASGSSTTEVAQRFVDAASGSWWAIAAYAVLAVVRPVVLFPATVLTVVAGVLYGTVLGVFVGGLLGLTAGYLRGRFEGLVLGVSDVVLAFPGLVLLLVLLAYVGRSLVAISVIIGILSIPLYARVARANTLSVTEHEYVRAASVLGATRTRVVLREVLPNIVLPLTAYAFVALGRVIVLEGSLAFLGLSVKPPDPTWGQMIADSKRHISDTLWPLIPAASAMFFTVLALSLIGDRLRRTIDVRGEDA